MKNRITNKYLLLISATAFYVSVLSLSGCTEGTSDLEAWVADVKARPQQGVEPLPEVIPYKTFAYNKSDKRDPFDASIFRPKIGQTAPKHFSSITPDSNRVPEYLESFPLDTLRMVGTMQQDEQTWALIKTPDNTIQRVLEGNYLGQNNGKIISVADDEVELAEIIPDEFGGWRERSSSIALSE
ncbi:MAG: pilus assembly protein PilP [Gammaproteobacteria bacterium]|nr:pilus assembly protein PilP [Gammaproteobacteria bacterium]